jgi:hypothetical protein
VRAIDPYSLLPRYKILVRPALSVNSGERDRQRITGTGLQGCVSPNFHHSSQGACTMPIGPCQPSKNSMVLH